MSDAGALKPRERAIERVGQCVLCAHSRKLTSAKGSDFYRCEKAREDETLLAYPPLPVRDCRAFERGRETREPDL